MNRKIVSVILMALFLSCFCFQVHAAPKVDLDLSEMSMTMMYSTLYNMLCYPEKYVGKSIRITGLFDVYENPDQHTFYPALLVSDATACCSAGIEFVLKGNPVYPSGYPDLGIKVTVSGRFELYTENSAKYCHLVDSEIEE